MPNTASVALPGWALLPATLLLLGLLFWSLRSVRDAAARFVVLALWLRFLMGAYHEITYPPSFAGLSLNALASVLVVCAGIFIVAPRGWRLRAMAPVYGVVLALLLSGLLHRAYVDLVNAGVKWAYFAVLLLASYQAIRRLALPRFAGALMGAFAAPVLLQGLSLALGVSKRASEDGGRAFIGGYEHEAAFSLVLLAGLWVAAWVRARLGWRLLLALVLLGGLFLAGYRTTLLAAAPLAAAVIATGLAGASPRRERPALALLALLACAGAIGLGGYLLRERFADFAVIAANDQLLREPGAYTLAERDLLSARLYLWSQYLHAWTAAGFRELWFGFGPESWRGVFATYAHNTLVSSLYEFGLFGLAAVLTLWGGMFALALRVKPLRDRWLLLAGHASFFLVNMATMGHWLLEGLILYALICAVTTAKALPPRPAWRPRPQALRAARRALELQP